MSFGSTPGAGAKVALDRVVTAFTIYPGSTAAYLEVPFAALSKTPPFDQLEARREIQRRLNDIPEVTIRTAQAGQIPKRASRSASGRPRVRELRSAIDSVLADSLAARA